MSFFKLKIMFIDHFCLNRIAKHKENSLKFYIYIF